MALLRINLHGCNADRPERSLRVLPGHTHTAHPSDPQQVTGIVRESCASRRDSRLSPTHTWVLVSISCPACRTTR